MAKKGTMLPMPTSGGIRTKVIGTLVALAVLVIVVKYPGEAAGMVKSLARAVVAVVDGLVAFIRQLG